MLSMNEYIPVKAKVPFILIINTWWQFVVDFFWPQLSVLGVTRLLGQVSHPTPNTHLYQIQIQIQNTKYKIQNTKYNIQNTKYKYKQLQIWVLGVTRLLGQVSHQTHNCCFPTPLVFCKISSWPKKVYLSRFDICLTSPIIHSKMGHFTNITWKLNSNPWAMQNKRRLEFNKTK